jgi:DNA-binding transcriptional LysR family regulator
MEFRQLTYFLAAAQTQNFRKAAEICLVAQPALSRQIASLEAELGVALFKREKQHVVLTPQGQEFVLYAKQALEQLQQGQQALVNIQEGQEGTITLGCVEPLATAFLPAIFSRFHQRYPRIRLSVHVGRTDEVLRQVEQGEMELGLIFDPAIRPDILVVIELFHQSLRLLVPTKHPFAQESVNPAVLTLERIAEEPLVLLRETSRLRRLVERLFTQRGMTVRPVVEIDSIEGLKELVKRECGLTFIFPALLGMDQASKDFAVLSIADVTEQSTFALIYRRFGTIAAPARQLINMIALEYAQDAVGDSLKPHV